MRYWGEVKLKAEECVKHVLEGGNESITLHNAIGKAAIECPEDWDALVEFCEEYDADCRDMNRIYRAQVAWIQAHNELEYKKGA
jgi:hypothetical protein